MMAIKEAFFPTMPWISYCFVCLLRKWKKKMKNKNKNLPCLWKIKKHKRRNKAKRENVLQTQIIENIPSKSRKDKVLFFTPFSFAGYLNVCNLVRPSMFEKLSFLFAFLLSVDNIYPYCCFFSSTWHKARVNLIVKQPIFLCFHLICCTNNYRHLQPILVFNLLEKQSFWWYTQKLLQHNIIIILFYFTTLYTFFCCFVCYRFCWTQEFLFFWRYFF